MLGFFFGPTRNSLPDQSEIPGLAPGDAEAVMRFGALGLIDGSWPVVGRVSEFGGEYDGYDRAARQRDAE